MDVVSHWTSISLLIFYFDSQLEFALINKLWRIGCEHKRTKHICVPSCTCFIHTRFQSNFSIGSKATKDYMQIQAYWKTFAYLWRVASTVFSLDFHFHRNLFSSISKARFCKNKLESLHVPYYWPRLLFSLVCYSLRFCFESFKFRFIVSGFVKPCFLQDWIQTQRTNERKEKKHLCTFWLFGTLLTFHLFSFDSC